MLDIIIEARIAVITDTVKVKRILPFCLKRMVGPFIFMDHAGPMREIPYLCLSGFPLKAAF